MVYGSGIFNLLGYVYSTANFASTCPERLKIEPLMLIFSLLGHVLSTQPTCLPQHTGANGGIAFNTAHSNVIAFCADNFFRSVAHGNAQSIDAINDGNDSSPLTCRLELIPCQHFSCSVLSFMIITLARIEISGFTHASRINQPAVTSTISSST